MTEPVFHSPVLFYLIGAYATAWVLAQHTPFRERFPWMTKNYHRLAYVPVGFFWPLLLVGIVVFMIVFFVCVVVRGFISWWGEEIK